MIEYVLKQIDQSSEEIVQFTQRLIQIPSENKPPLGFEKECQEYLINFLKNVGVEIDSFLPTDVEGIRKHPAFLAEGAPFPCDAFLFNKFGNTPVVCLGPEGGNAHAPDEFVSIKSLVDLTKIFALIIFNWCNSPVAL